MNDKATTLITDKKRTDARSWELRHNRQTHTDEQLAVIEEKGHQYAWVIRGQDNIGRICVACGEVKHV